MKYKSPICCGKSGHVENTQSMSSSDAANHAPPVEVFPADMPAHEQQLLTVRVWLNITGWVLLAIWALWWVVSFKLNTLLFGRMTLVPAWPFLGLDFFHNYFGSIAWLSGRDPYLYPFGDGRGLFGYPPIVLPMFAWCVWVSFSTAVAIFAGLIAAISTTATFMSLHFRSVAAMVDVTAPLAVAAILLSMPVIFAMERGNCDTLVLMMMLIAAWAMARNMNWSWDVVAGVALAVAFWIRIYPGVLFLAPLAMRRYRVFVIAVVVAALIGVAMMSQTAEWLSALGSTQNARVGPIKEITDWVQGKASTGKLALQFNPIFLRSSHSLTTYWPLFWGRIGLEWLARVPSLLCAGLILGLLTLWGSYCIWRTSARGWIVYPYLLWLALVATFLMPLSYDYNMIYLPLLILSVWDRRDPRWVHVLMFSSCLLWWQPFTLHVPLEADVLIIAKLVSLAVVTVCLMRRVREVGTSVERVEHAGGTGVNGLSAI